MDTKNRRRKPLLIAAVVAAGVAVTVNAVAPSTSASSATAAAAAKVTAGAGRAASGAPKVSLVVSTAAPANTGRDLKMCAAAHGTYQGTVVRTVPVMGDMGTVKGRRGGTVIVMRSTVCGTAWAQVKKDGKNDKRAYPTSIWIATYATEATDHSKLGENYREADTRQALSTRAVPAGWHGTLEVEARWAGKGFVFYNAVPIVY
jgi:hypothetical protein